MNLVTLRISVLLLMSQVACFSASKVASSPNVNTKSEATPRGNEDRKNNLDDQIDLRDHSQIRDVELAEKGLIVLTALSKSDSFKPFRQDIDKSWKGINFSEAVDCISFTDTKNGWAVDRNLAVWQTVDGASTWNQIGKVPDKSPASQCETLQFTSSVSGWLADFNGVFSTSDGGKSWGRIHQLPSNVGKLRFFDYLHGWVASVDENNNSILYTTSDGGNSWSSAMSKKLAFDEIFPQSIDRGWMILRGGQVFETSDRGTAWRKPGGIPKNFLGQSIYCTEATTCFVAGYMGSSERWSNPRNGSAAVFRTKDNGQTWVRINILTDEHFFSKVRFFTPAFGVLAGQNILYISQDGGDSWIEALNLKPAG